MKEHLRRAAGPPGSVRHSLTLLGCLVVAAEVLLALTDGLVAAATGLALITVVALGVARYVGGAGAQDSGYRKSVRLLGGRAPALGEWPRVVRKALGPEGALHFHSTLRPQLQRLFAARLAERHGVLLRKSPDRARAIVGPDLWPWIDPTTGPPQPAIPEAVLRSLLDRLETL
ncbi:hypothetical protein [Streptomyces sp. NPDC088910]|uniref:hypothetical protein n=1 Tax=Streptomyces sp. NPDC088910 TaxID=3365911 RepID=UPI00380F995D